MIIYKLASLQSLSTAITVAQPAPQYLAIDALHLHLGVSTAEKGMKATNVYLIQDPNSNLRGAGARHMSLHTQSHCTRARKGLPETKAVL